MDANAGETFQRDTRYRRGDLPRGGMDPNRRPASSKVYVKARRVALPKPHNEDGHGLWEVMLRRRSERRYRGEALSTKDLSQLLWATQGVTGHQQGIKLRAAPSAGGLYPIETYLALHNVEGVEVGIYHYLVGDHALEEVAPGDFRAPLAAAALDQGFTEQAACVFVWSAVFERSAWKYGQRAYRYVYLDAGHIAQNLALAAVALGLGTCQIAALYDDEANDLIGLDGERESVIYMSSVGRAA